jgi:hypothetical protein
MIDYAGRFDWKRQMSEHEDRAKEVDANYEAFLQMLPSLITTHRGRYALMKDKKILGIYSTATDARIVAEQSVPDKLFSIQEVTDVDVDLGYFSRAVHSNTLLIATLPPHFLSLSELHSPP